MKITAKAWLLFIFAAIICLGLWYKFGYPQFTFVDLSIDKKEALNRAESYLRFRKVEPKEYLRAVVFDTDNWTDRYLQKTLGLKSEEEFIKRHGYELFSWQIRFFKEFQKEEYVIGVSPKSGEIINFRHLIEDIEPREAIQKENAKAQVEEFLRKTYGLNLKEYDFHEEKTKRYEQRIDYGFSWEKKGVYIPWQKNQGGAKLLIGATISGNEIRDFYKSRLDIPERFRRYIENQFVFGEYLSSFSFLLFMLLVISSIFIVVKRKQTLVIRLSKKCFLYLGIFFLCINIIYILNNLQNLIISYPTSTRLSSFIGIYLIKLIINLIFLSVAFILPGLAGEYLRSETMPDNKYSSFLHYIKSTLYSRSMAKSIILGHILFFIFLGFQATIFYFGQRYLGVWREWFKLTQLSSSFIPFLSAFVIGSSASLNEEIVFRLFGISWVKRYLKNTVLAVVLTSLIWGFGHTEYPIFPVWFRGIEVSLLGLLFGFIFIRYGIIPLIVAHYLFDVFWGVAAYILGHSSSYLLLGSLLVLAIPLAFAMLCFLINKDEKEKETKAILDSTQEYNLDILKTFISAKKSHGLGAQSIKEELLRHNWDVTLVDLAIAEVFKEK
jgi:membrane protease YdiL (CAAX protease family)